MAVSVGSARIDENGRISGGKAGDQTGREISRQSWYLHAKGWRVFRAKKAETAARIAEAMNAACDNGNIGYDQHQRNTLYAKAEKVDFDIRRVKEKCETDCSALVRVCCAWAGITGLPSGFRTANMAGYLLKTGAFTELTGDKYTRRADRLGPGDILVTRTSGHTVVVLTKGDKYEADPEPERYAPGDRLLKNGREGEDVRGMQAMLMDLGYDLSPWGADGDFGDVTEMAVMAFQRDHSLAADGIYGPDTHRALMDAHARRFAGGEGDTVTVTGGDCWVRDAPHTGGSRLGVAKQGSRLPYAGQTSPEGWHRVAYDGRAGWVSGKYGRLE